MNEMNTPFITMNGVVPAMYGVNFASNIEWTINKGEQWAVVGANGSGKSLLAEVLLGRTACKGEKIKYNFFDEKSEEYKIQHFPVESIAKVCFESAYSMADYKNMYYQQRFNSTENEENPTVEEILKAATSTKEEFDYWNEKLNLSPLFPKRIIMLSSGELRRFLIASVLIRKPDLIIFDNPFIGLDKQTCAQLNAFFKELGKFQQMIFIVPALAEIPDVVTHVMPVKDMAFGPTMTREAFDQNTEFQSSLFEKRDFPVVELPEAAVPQTEYNVVMDMKDINISYPQRTLFKDLNWKILKGEKWALSGPNGSGKSTLLSLLAADNPRAYAQNITLFDKRRGTGETIWDIKRKIGYISSEMHLYFHADQTCLRIVDSGFFDTIGLYKKCTEEQEQIALCWMKMLGIDGIADKPYLKVSSGEQRLVLLARSLVKNPDLLILDEPLHGLDMQNKENARKVIETYCAQPGRTMIYVTHRRNEIPSCVTKFFELEKLD